MPRPGEAGDGSRNAHRETAAGSNDGDRLRTLGFGGAAAVPAGQGAGHGWWQLRCAGACRGWLTVRSRPPGAPLDDIATAHEYVEHGTADAYYSTLEDGNSNP
jgi:hypothetical protein